MACDTDPGSDDGDLDFTMEDHDRLVRLEERVTQWMRSIDRRLGVQHQVLMAIVGLVGSGAVSVVVWLITRTP